MKKRRTTLLLICIIACNYTPIFSAEIPLGVIDYIETVEESKIDGEEIVELLNELEENPLDINNSSEEDLLQIPDLTEIDVNNILLHRKRYGKFQTLYELKHLPNFTQEKIFKIVPFRPRHKVGTRGGGIVAGESANTGVFRNFAANEAVRILQSVEII